MIDGKLLIAIYIYITKSYKNCKCMDVQKHFNLKHKYRKAGIIVKNKSAIVFILTSIIFTILLSSSVVFSLNANILGVPPDIENKVVKVLAQGWGFFSKDPREPMLYAYPLSGNEYDELQWPNNSIKNLIGLNRFGRAQGIELGSIITEIPGDGFKECEKNYQNCIDKENDIIEVNNIYENPTICGEWGIVLLEPIPWAWADVVDELDML